MMDKTGPVRDTGVGGLRPGREPVWASGIGVNAVPFGLDALFRRPLKGSGRAGWDYPALGGRGVIGPRPFNTKRYRMRWPQRQPFLYRSVFYSST
jgi:hypothetical protein